VATPLIIVIALAIVAIEVAVGILIKGTTALLIIIIVLAILAIEVAVGILINVDVSRR
jgi:hypothetical protein